MGILVRNASISERKGEIAIPFIELYLMIFADNLMFYRKQSRVFLYQSHEFCPNELLQLAVMAIKKLNITKTSPCNEDPLIPHFYIVKLGFTGVYIIFLFLL